MKTYWYQRGKHQEFYYLLQKLLETTDLDLTDITNKCLKAYKEALHIYKLYHNNELCGETTNVFGVNYQQNNSFEKLLEETMNQLIEQVIIEQDITADDITLTNGEQP